MGIDAVLNLVWGLMAVGSLAAFGLAELRGRRRSKSRRPWHQGLAVFVAAVALFPCISASDDILRFEQLEVGAQAEAKLRAPASKKSSPKPAAYLARLLEALENFRTAGASKPLVARCCLTLVPTGSHRNCERSLPSSTGRSPPPANSLA